MGIDILATLFSNLCVGDVFFPLLKYACLSGSAGSRVWRAGRPLRPAGASAAAGGLFVKVQASLGGVGSRVHGLRGHSAQHVRS